MGYKLCHRLLVSAPENGFLFCWSQSPSFQMLLSSISISVRLQWHLWHCGASQLVPQTSVHFLDCDFLPHDNPFSVTLVLFSGAFLNLGSSAIFISTFLTLHATVTNENSQQYSQCPALKSSMIIPFSQRISFSHNAFPFIQINTSCTFSELVQIPIFSCKEPFSMWSCVTYFTEVQINWIHCMSSRKSLAKKPEEMNICLANPKVVLHPSSHIYLCL